MPRSTFARVPLLVVSMVLLAACTDEPLGNVGPAEPRVGAAGGNQRGTHKNLDDQLADLTVDAPGFGGFSWDNAGILKVFLTDLTKSEAARSTIGRFMRDRGRDGITVGSGAPPIRFVQGRHNFRQLKVWKDALRAVVFSSPGVVFLDIDDSSNQLTIGLATSGDENTVRRLIAPLNIPESVIAYEVRGRTTRLATLREAASIRNGGVGIGIDRLIPSGQLQDCTLGFNIFLPEGHGFVTNSHCTGGFAMMDGTSMSQGGQWIGTEVQDVPLFQGGDCPGGRYCRQSDAAIIQYLPGVSLHQGIAFTGLPACTTQSCEDRLTWTTNMKVSYQSSSLPTMNQTLNKTGQRTGWTQGPVVNTCADTDHDSIVWNGQFVIPLMLCQSHVQAHANSGDSGSPVYVRYTKPGNESSTGWSELFGVLWGGNPTRTIYYFSSMPQIEAEFGPLEASYATSSP